MRRFRVVQVELKAFGVEQEVDGKWSIPKVDGKMYVHSTLEEAREEIEYLKKKNGSTSSPIVYEEIVP